jgi:predicted dehydrogenase
MPGLVRSGMLTAAAAGAAKPPSRRVQIAVVGGGLITQAAHLPNLMQLQKHFDVVAVSDPSKKVRDGLATRFGVRTVSTFEEALSSPGLEAVLICSPNSAHLSQIMLALEAGVDVLVEKPLCLSVNDALTITAAAKAAGRTVMVAYMKQYDPAFEAMLEALPSDMSGLRFVNVVTYDPIMSRPPFFRPGSLIWGDDVPAELREQVAEQEREQVRRAIGEVSADDAATYSSVYTSAFSHDLNAVHAMLRKMGEPLPAQAVESAYWAEGDAASGTIRLASGAQWKLTWMLLDGLQRFHEQIALFFADAVHELTMPAPYLGWPATYRCEGRSGDAALVAQNVAPGEAYLRELSHFHACMTEGTQCRTPASDAIIDLTMARDLFLHMLEARSTHEHSTQAGPISTPLTG